MASHDRRFGGLLFFAVLVFTAATFSRSSAVNSTVYPLHCSAQLITSCNASLYVHAHNNGFTAQQLASLYSVDASQVKPFPPRGAAADDNKKDFLVVVPCSCLPAPAVGGAGYFYDVAYAVQDNDSFFSVSNEYFEGQAWSPEDEPKLFSGTNFTVSLVCGCVESDSQVVVTYTVQQGDTLSDITERLSAELESVEKLNGNLTQNPSFLQPGGVLFVPMEKNGLLIRPSSSGKNKRKWEIVLGVLLSVSALSTSGLIFVIIMRRKQSKAPSAATIKSHYSSQRRFVDNKDMEGDMTAFESDRPVVFSLEEIEDATCSFDETKKIGQGGFGSVYYGILGEKEVAVKKMRSNKSKEFFAELKVLCKIHHINVVELLGYASGDDHLYLVYEFIQKGSLSDHLHDPLLKGHQALSWTARTQIALGAAKGIEYIHDHTKAQYVHRDIKTSNILLDEGLRAKVADFGLAKLVGRANEDDPIATRLVGTPGYLPPESVQELQVTPKVDVFAFGVVLAELITGKRALIRDNREPAKMKSIITIVKNIFRDNDPESALEVEIDGNLRDGYPINVVFKMAEIAESCLSEDAVDRPEMRDVVVMLNQIVTSSTEWEASLGGNSQVFSGVFNGR